METISVKPQMEIVKVRLHAVRCSESSARPNLYVKDVIKRKGLQRFYMKLNKHVKRRPDTGNQRL